MIFILLSMNYVVMIGWVALIIPLFAFLIFSLICAKRINFISRNKFLHIFSLTIGKSLKKIIPWVVLCKKRQLLELAFRYLDETSSIDYPISLFLTSVDLEIVMLFRVMYNTKIWSIVCTQFDNWRMELCVPKALMWNQFEDFLLRTTL